MSGGGGGGQVGVRNRDGDFFIVNYNSDNALSNKLLSNIMYTDAILNIYSRYTFNTLTSNSFVLQLPYPLHR